MDDEYGRKRGEVLAHLTNGELGDKRAAWIAGTVGCSTGFVYEVRKQERKRLAAAQKLPKLKVTGATPWNEVGHLITVRLFNVIGCLYDWRADLTLREVTSLTDDYLIRTPNMGRLSLKTLRDTFGYGADYPEGETGRFA